MANNEKFEDVTKNGNHNPNNSLNDLTGKEWVKFTKSWFIHNPKPRRKDEILHPAKFPEDMIKDFILFFTKRGQTVLDPFLGTGSTLVACNQSARKGFGIELMKKYADISETRIKQKNIFDLNLKQTVIEGDSKNIKNVLTPKMKELGVDKIDFVITSPPYWNMLKKSRGGVKSASKQRVDTGLDEYYSDNPNDLGNLNEYNDFLNEMLNIFSQIYDILKNGAYVVIIIQNILIPEGKMVPLAWDVAKKLSSKYVLKQEKIWCQDNKLLGCWGYPKAYVSNVHHHYCLIFQKKESL